MIHDADYQMSLSYGQDDPLNILKYSFFSCLIGIYFSPFFFEHTVCIYIYGNSETGDASQFHRRQLAVRKEHMGGQWQYSCLWQTKNIGPNHYAWYSNELSWI